MNAKKFTRTQLIAINALLTAIIFLFVLVPISIGPLQLAFIPLVAVIVSAEFIGWKNGLITGLTFGLVSLLSAFVRPNILSQVFYNPLVSVLPRVLIGVVTYFVMRGVQKGLPRLNPIFSYAIGAAMGVITNTTLVLGTILLLHFGATFGGLYIGWEWIVATITGNFLIELGVCTAITPPIVLALQKSRR